MGGGGQHHPDIDGSCAIKAAQWEKSLTTRAGDGDSRDREAIKPEPASGSQGVTVKAKAKGSQ